jgi:hypothetical protein
MRFPALAVAVALMMSFCPKCPPAAAAGDVVAVVACDGYADLKKQIRWIGTLVGNPALDGFAESFIMMATQFKGLAGLDVNRPAGLVVTVQGDDPVIHGFVPVKDLDRLLGALQGVLGPAERNGDLRQIAPPGGMRLDITERNGWAIFTPRGTQADLADPSPLFDPVVKSLSLGAQVFPSRMPAGMRAVLRAGIDQAAEMAAAQGQDVDRAALDAALAGLDDTESFLLGLAIDEENDRVFVETRTVMDPNSVAAALWTAAGKAAGGTVALPPPTQGKILTLRAHHAQTVPEAARRPLEATLDQALPGGDDPIARAVGGLVRDLVGGMLDAGGFDAGVAIDTSTATEAEPLPAVTVGVRVKDGRALEERVKTRLGAAGALPPGVTARFDTGAQGKANLHEIAVDLAGLPDADKFGGRLAITLAVTPDYAYVLTGGDVPARVGKLLAADRPQPPPQPLIGGEVSLAGLLDYAAKAARVFAAGNPLNAELAQMAEAAADNPEALVRLLVRPIDRGVSLRLAADGGVIRTIATSVSAVQPAGGVGGFELRPGRGAPAIAP